MDTHVVIMAGGIGSRLWPMSTPEEPKQFVDVLGTGKSMLQMTVDRFLPVCPVDRFWIVTSAAYADDVKRQLPDVPADHILAEPQPRNTAPCIAYACWKIASGHPDANIVVTPSDAVVFHVERFRALISEALTVTEDSGSIVTIGINPVRPETGYGYIRASEGAEGKVVKVSEFKEKPDLETARKYLADGRYYWNAGIFVWNVSTIFSQLRRYAPQIAGVMDELALSFGTPGEADALERLFPTCDRISIDYAVMEKSDDIYVISGDLGWSDLGSWSSVREHIGHDADGNAVVGGNVGLYGCKDSVVHVSGIRSAVVEGLDGYIVSFKDGRLLVCRLSEEQKIKDFSAGK